MLEVKNLVKEYRPKKGNPVRAVDGISLKFPEKGMVFILGKSGSGKSTLLNLLGGLDKYDSGEIIIKGKSSKDFSQSEFDSYRNTYLGFIFQEYNILNDFNVAQNIAIALQLQGQKATDERINEILKEVDLDGYGGRKPSELSGGQKQRVAIARALVKNPEIIMADEPTGALDSKTGLQVFDTLKKLSEDKLVIVITHDRDFAEMYGDRVIELKDGKVISDIEKYTASAKEVGEGIKVTDDKVIAIKKGYVLTESDVKLINEYLQRNEMLISVDEKANGDLKRFARINDEGEKESFRQTDESKIKVSEDKKFRLIKSRLPLKNMIVIGASGLKNKPIRLIVTILLSLVAFTMFGLTDTLAAYNKIKATEKSIEDSAITSATFTLTEHYVISEGGNEWNYTDTTWYTDRDVAAFNEKTGMDFRPVVEGSPVSPSNYYKNNISDTYYSVNLNMYICADQEYIRSLGYTFIGEMPKGEKEIAISKFVYDGFAQHGYRNNDKDIDAKDITDPAAFLARSPVFSIDGEDVRITAIIDTKFNEEKYASLISENEDMNLTDFFLYEEKENDIDYGYHGLIFVGQEFWNKALKNIERINQTRIGLTKNVKDYYIAAGYSECICLGKNETDKVEYFGEQTTLNEGEALIDVLTALEILSQWSYERTGAGDDTAQMYRNALNNYYSYKQEGYSEEELSEYGMAIVNDQKAENYIQSAIMPYLRKKSNMISGEYRADMSANSSGSRSMDVNVVGVYTGITDGKQAMVFGDDLLENIRSERDKKYAWVIAGNVTNAQWKKLIQLHYGEEGEDLAHTLRNGAMFTIGMLNDMIETLSEVFLYVGIGFALFAALMLTNFISTSIVFKRREIGILRAVGARGSDVYGIFAIESVIIALINFALATIATGVVTAVIEASFKNEYHLSVRILDFGIRQIGLIFGVAVAVALIASFLPTFRISRQKPVDAIKK